MEDELDSLALHLNANGELRFPRVILHTALIEDLISGHAVQEDPRVTFMAGGPASGKSHLASGITLPNDAAHIDVDAIRVKLPEYAEWQISRTEDAARLTHREASDIAKRALATAVQRGINVVFDAVGGDDDDAFSEKIRFALESGNKVRVSYATCPVAVALERQRERFARTGRRVPEDILERKHAEVSRGVENVAGLAVELIEIYETTTDPPMLLARGAGGEGLGGLEVIHAAGYAAFLEKGRAS